MNRKSVQIWIVVSLAAWAIGYVGKFFMEGIEIFFWMYFLGWISSMFAIGYYSKPSHVLFGNIVYGFIILMIVGIVLKILHLTGANEIILAGLAGATLTYLIMWLNDKKKVSR